MSDNLSQWISAEVVKRGWTLRYVAKKAGISHATVARIANGEVPRPTSRVCSRLAGTFGVPTELIYRLAGMLPENAPSPGALRERRLHYRIGNFDMTARMIELFEALDADEQELVVLLLERLAQARAEPRIVGEAADESG